MHSLFLDSTSGLVIGLLDSKYSWIEYMSFNEKKPSEIVHYEIFNFLKKHGLNLVEMQCFVSSGPGSYTGMRLGEGLAQVFELSKMPVYSFYHFDVPRLSGVAQGFWVTSAFKGQVFLYNWDGAFFEKKLLDKNIFQIKEGISGYTLNTTDPLFEGLISTSTLIKDEASTLFTKIREQKLRVAPYYFRSLDEEFC